MLIAHVPSPLIPPSYATKANKSRARNGKCPNPITSTLVAKQTHWAWYPRSMEALPEATDKPLAPAAEKVVAAYLKLGNVSQAEVGRYLGKSRNAVWKQVTKSDTVSHLTQRREEQSDKATGVVAKLTRIVRKVVGGVEASIDRDPCDHCGNQPVTIQELAGMLKVSTDGLKTMLELRDNHGLDSVTPQDGKLVRELRSKDRARVVRLARVLKLSYQERERGWPSLPG